MAYLLGRISVPRYTPPIEVQPDKQLLRARREAFRDTLLDDATQRQNRGERHAWIDAFFLRAVRLPVDCFASAARAPKSNNSLPHCINLHAHYGVSEVWRDVIEELEPGHHQFVECDVRMKDGRSADMRYFSLQVMTVLRDLPDPARTTSPFSIRKNGERYYNNSDLGTIVIDRTRIAGRHLWRSEDIHDGFITVSDEMWRRMDAAKIRGFKAKPMIEA